MRFPAAPPVVDKVLGSVQERQDQEKLLAILTQFGPTDNKARYLHWDELRYKEPPVGFTAEEYWAGIKFARNKLLRKLPFADKVQRPFLFGTPEPVLRMLYEIDRIVNGRMETAVSLTDMPAQHAYLLNSVLEEAINSSQLEGASTTRSAAKEMLRQNRPPRDRSEQMIFNNYQAMQFVQAYKDERLTPDVICELHRIVTDKTLEDPDDAGQMRTADDAVEVIDKQGHILYVPPKAEELPHRLTLLCAFANGSDTAVFVHPLIRAILLHFMLAYDHPFVDGNGRTARALFYWSMARAQYRLLEFVSISQIIKEAPAQYARAFLYTETDGNDTTYFIIHQLRVIQRALEALNTYLGQKARALQSAAQLLAGTRWEGVLNERQLALLEYALEQPTAVFRIKTHQNYHRVTYQTARTDLLQMAEEWQLLNKVKQGKTFLFLPPPDLRQRLEDLRG